MTADMAPIVANNCGIQQLKERNAQKLYWEHHSKEGSIEEMMLDSRAVELTVHERPEILNYVNINKDTRVLELGAGIGRFTGHIAQNAKSVLAVDFMEKFVQKNKETHGHLENTSFLAADVTKMEYQENAYDLVFTNWLFMYLSDQEVLQVFAKILGSLTDGGIFMFRESCFHPSGNHGRESNPTHYRSPEEYEELLLRASLLYKKKGVSLVLKEQHTVQTYVEMKQNPNQKAFVSQKINTSQHSKDDNFQEFLDKQQYTSNGILRYERMFGKNFVSTGGLYTTELFVPELGLKSGELVLDVGAGIGGSAFYMVENYDANVLGIDLSENMINIAKARSVQEPRVNFLVEDCTLVDYPAGTFDVIYSRDTILHIADKLALFKNFYKWLKPGGRVMITDYCRGETDGDEEFKEYVKQRGYHLTTVEEYNEILKAAGFLNSVAKNKTQLFVEVLHNELAKLKSNKEEYVKDFSSKDFQDIEDGWNAKVVRCGKDYQNWGLWTATK